MKGSIAAFAFLLSASLAAACGAGEELVLAADVMTQRELVTVMTADGGAEELLRGEERQLRVADRVTVDTAGEAQLRFSDWLVVTLFRDSDLRVEAVADPGAPPWARLRLEAGCVFNSLTAGEAAEHRLTITTEWATIEAIGTEFLVHFDPQSDVTWVVVSEGSVEVRAAGVTETVGAGYQSWVEPGEKPQPPIEARRSLIGDGFPLINDLTGDALDDVFMLPDEFVDLGVMVNGPGHLEAPGIQCGGDCTESYPIGTKMTLRAEPEADAVFAGWGGACAGDAPTCVVTMDQDRFVSAQFEPEGDDDGGEEVEEWSLEVTRGGDGAGMVTSSPAGISCGYDCSQVFDDGVVVQLTAASSEGAVFAGWGGACAGDAPTCVVTMDQDRFVSAQFEPEGDDDGGEEVEEWSLEVTRGGDGAGMVTSSPAGISCGYDCSQVFDDGVVVQLTAASSEGAVFAGWGGACAGDAPTCVVTMDQDRFVSAQFDVVEGSGPDPTPPAAPSGLHVSETVGATFSLGFVDNSDDELGFYVYVGGSWFATLGPNETSFSVTPVCEIWPVAVSAFNDDGESSMSNTINVLGECPPEPPSGLHVSGWSDGTANMGFIDNANNETGFNVRVGGSNYMTLDANDTTFSVSPVCETWPVSVTAFNAVDESPPSNTINVTGPCPSAVVPNVYGSYWEDAIYALESAGFFNVTYWFGEDEPYHEHVLGYGCGPPDYPACAGETWPIDTDISVLIGCWNEFPWTCDWEP